MKVLPVFLSLVLTACAMAADGPWRDLNELSVRGGLPNLEAKLQRGETVKIAYLGGSITAQAGWRVFSADWFQERYPSANVESIHAAIGGTGSDLGVFRLERDVLQHDPDLVFIEFAVNDRAYEKYRLAMEGIVRKIWRRLPDCDICLVYTITNNEIEHLRKGKMKSTSSFMEELADYYGITSVHMGVEIVEMEKAGKLVMKAPKAEMEAVSGDALNESSDLGGSTNQSIAFAKDGVHPYLDTGHKLYMAALARSLPQALEAGEPGDHILPAPMFENNWEAATVIPLSHISDREGPWIRLESPEDVLAKNFLGRMPELWRAEPGAKLSFRFKGTRVAIYDLLGPGCGTVRATVDGKTSTHRRMDGYCHYFRISNVELAQDLEDTLHEVEIEVLPEPFDKRSVLFERARYRYDETPEKFAEINWYPGAVFLLGELVE